MKKNTRGKETNENKRREEKKKKKPLRHGKNLLKIIKKNAYFPWESERDQIQINNLFFVEASVCLRVYVYVWTQHRERENEKK